MAKIERLNPNRFYARQSFNSYILSEKTVSTESTSLEVEPYQALPSLDVHTQLHQDLFAQNLFQADPWARGSSYFVNCLGELVRIRLIGNDEDIHVVFRISEELGGGDAMCRLPGDYNYSFRFISKKYCVLCDGVRRLLLLEAENRRCDTEWKLVAEATIKVDKSMERNFMLYDSRLDFLLDDLRISVALGRVNHAEKHITDESGYRLDVHWGLWYSFDDKWHFELVETLVGEKSIQYCAFEPYGQSLIICSMGLFEFKSAYKRTEKQKEMEKFIDDQREEERPFKWWQTDREIIISFHTRSEARNLYDYIIESTESKLLVTCRGTIKFNEILFSNVDQTLTTWTFESNSLILTLCKAIVGIKWDALYKASFGDYSMSPDPSSDTEQPVDDTFDDNEYKLVRYNLVDKNVTHIVPLGITPPLFATELYPGSPRALVTADGNNGDACLWRQEYDEIEPSEWSLHYEGHLHFYWQGCRNTKKFIDFSPDLSYAVAVERMGNAYIYEHIDGKLNDERALYLVNNKKVINLEQYGKIIGMTTAPGSVKLLTEKSIIYLQIES